jgi:hypothetical protein
MKAKLIYCALVLVPALVLGACSNLAGFSPEYRQAHEKAFWQEYKGGGVDAMAVANLKAHDAAERAAGR